jgi:hypothetical protein
MGRDSAKAAKKTANSSVGSAASAEYAAKQQAIRQRHLAIMEEDSEAKKSFPATNQLQYVIAEH